MSRAYLRINVLRGELMMNRVKITVLLLMLAFLSLSLGGCGGEREEQGAVDGDRYGGTLVVGISGDIDSLNPVVGTSVGGSNVMGQIYMSLATMNEDMEFEPDLATSWEFSEDHLELTYYLRKDVVWTDGVPVTARDVRASAASISSRIWSSSTITR
jgi:peptide/nickel transport system substrate-binding protein